VYFTINSIKLVYAAVKATFQADRPKKISFIMLTKSILGLLFRVIVPR